METKLSVRFESDVYSKIQEMAMERNMTPSAYVRNCVKSTMHESGYTSKIEFMHFINLEYIDKLEKLKRENPQLSEQINAIQEEYYFGNVEGYK